MGADVPGRAGYTGIAVVLATFTALLVPPGTPASANHPTGTCLDVADEALSAEKGMWSIVRVDLRTQVDGGAACGPSAAVAGPGGVDVDAEVTGPNDPDGADTPATPDTTCTIEPGASGCAASLHIPATGTDTVRVWIDHDGSDATPDGDLAEAVSPDDGDSTDVVTRTSEVRVPGRLDCDLRYPPGAATDVHRTPLMRPRDPDDFVCSVATAAGEPVAAPHPVWAEVLGPSNDPDDPDSVSYTSPDYECDRDGAQMGTCFLVFELEGTGGELGTSDICMWVGAPSDGAALCGAEPWDEGLAADGSDAGADLADTVRRSWEAPSAETGGLDVEPDKYADGVGAYYAPHAQVFDQFGQVLYGATPVRLELFAGSPGDTDGNTPATPDSTCTTNGSTCTFPALPNGAPSIALMCVWTNAAPAMSGDNTNGTCDGEGLRDPEDRLAWTDPPTPADDDVDVVQMSWDPPGRAYDLECLPRVSTGSVADVFLVTCTARARDGKLVPRVAVDVEATGLNDSDGATPASPDFTCTTGTDGRCSYSHGPVGEGGGTTEYRAWVDTDGSNATVEADTAEGWYDETETGDEAEPDTTSVAERTWVDVRPALLDCDDETGPATEIETVPSLAGAASEVTFTCRVADANGRPFTQDWLVGGEVHHRYPNDPDQPDYWTWGSLDYSCRTGDDGVCEMTVTQADDEVGDLVLCFVAERSSVGCGDDEANEPPPGADGSDEADDSADLVRVVWEPGGPVADSLDAEAETGVAPVGARQAVDVRVFDQDGTPYAGDTTVKFELFDGSPSDTDGNTPGTPDGSCATAGTFSCSFVYSQPAPAAGDDLVCAWTGSAPAMSGSGPSSLCESEPLVDEGFGGQGDLDGWDVPAPVDHYDVVKRTWQRSASVDCDDGTPAATEAEVNPSTGTGTSESYSCTVRDQDGAVVSGVSVKGEVVDPVNDPDSPDAASFATPDYSCTTSGGSCRMQVTQADSEAGTTTICFFTGTSGEGEAACAAEPFDENAAGGTDIDDDSADAVRLSWEARTAAAGGVDVEPELLVTPLGVQHVVGAVVYDQFGDPFAGNTRVSFEWFPGSPSDWDGLTPATPDRSCTTASYHRCSIAYTQARQPGTDVFCAWTNAAPAMSGAASSPSCDGEGLTDTRDGEAGDDVDLVAKRWYVPAARLDCDDSTGPPTEDEVNPAGGTASSEVYTCTVTDSSGAVVTANQTVAAEVGTPVNDPDASDGASFGSPDYSCQTGDDGVCQITVTQAEDEVGTTIVCFWTGTAGEGESWCGGNEPFDEGTGAGGGDAGADLADSARLSWEQRTATALDVEPEVSITELGKQHVISAVVYDQFGDPFAGNTKVSFEWFPGSPSDWDGTTPATPDRSCTTVAAPRCSFAYTQGRYAGTDVFCAWAGAAPAMSGTASAPGCDGEGLTDPDDDDTMHDVPSPRDDDVDLISKTWTVWPPTTLDCDDQGSTDTEWDVKPAYSGSDSNGLYTCKVKDGSGGPVPSGTLVRGEVMTEVNDPDAIDGASFSSTDYACTTAADGTCTITVSQSEGEIGNSVICFYVGSDWDGQSLCNSEGAFDALSPGGVDGADDLADAVELAWQVRQAGGGSLDVEPETSTSALGTQHTITAVVYDQFGDPFVGDTPVFFEWLPGSPSDWDGVTPSTPDRSCTTVNNSRCSIVYTQARYPGTDVFCVWTLYAPYVGGTSTDPQCGGEGLTDEDDTPGVVDARRPAWDRVDAISKTWTAGP